MKFLALLFFSLASLGCTGTGSRPLKNGETLIVLGFPATSEGVSKSLAKIPTG